MDIRNYLKQSSLYNVVVMNSLVSTKNRGRISEVSKTIIYSVLFIMILYYLVKDSSKFEAYQTFATLLTPKLIGLLALNIAIFVASKTIDIYLSSQYFFEYIVKNKYKKDDLYTFSAGKVLYAGRRTDILHGLFYSRIGKRLLVRLGISEKDSSAFIASQKITREVMPKQEGDILKLKDIVIYLYSKNQAFVEFLNNRGITDKILLGALDWVIFDIETREYRNQWWRPEALARVKGFATNWSFGRTFLLDKYSRDLMLDEQVSSDAFVISDRENEISQIETSLSKSSESNVLLIGEPGQEKIQVVWSLCRQIRDGNIVTALQDKRPILLLANILVSACKDKDFFEDQLIKILNEVVRAGNILLVMDNFPLLLGTAKQLGVDIVSLLDQYLASPNIQIIAMANIADYHKDIESDNGLMNRFEIVMVRELSIDENTRIIAESSISIEAQYGIDFTYQAVRELAESAGYYFPDGVSSDKAMDLLNEIAPWAKRRGTPYIDKDTVLEYIQQKTSIPTSGKISPEEKEKLINLEKLIGTRVIGQKEAITAVSNAMRRARSGVRNPNKPIGSFLFFGPTGVGKTETSKALAEVFFGSEDNMMRLDMSEYQTDDAMERLIGSFDSNKPGIFSSMLRDKPFGVVLLDEFEKTNKEVQNLFLQILDEGFFSDTNGKKVSTKNIIFIATSNAGADTIFKMISDNKKIESAKEEIIADIISRGLFKPELINRFDGTVIFHPLGDEDLKQIAGIMLKKVANRMIEKGIEVKISADLINYVVLNGSNKAFGARPMNRFIQDNVEGEIANLLIRKQLGSGNRLEFTVVDNILSSKVS